MEEKSRNELKNELRLAFGKELKTILGNESIDRMIELYEQFADLETSEEKGIRFKWIENVEGFYSFGDSTVNCHNYLINCEGFFKKVLYVIDSKEYENVGQDTSLCLYKTMTNLGFFKDLPKNFKFDSSPVELLTTPQKRAPIVTYRLRNTASHNAEMWTRSQMISNINDVMITTMLAVWYNREIIQNKINQIIGEGHGITSYLSKIVKDYEAEKRKGFVYYPLVWEKQGSDDDDKYKRIEIAEISTDKHILLSAKAGCGKTTSLQYLEYQLAKSYLENKSNKIPVNIALIDETPDTDIKEIICRKLNISLAYCEKLLEKGIIYFMADGLNELTHDMELRRKFVFALEKFLRTYPAVYAVVTDRESSLIPVRVEKTYQLKKMEHDDVLSYAKTKVECDENTYSLLEQVLETPAFKNMEFTPLMVNRLVISLSSSGIIPADKNELVGGFLEALMKREAEEKRDYNAQPRKLEIFLMKLAYEEVEFGEIDYLRALEICKEAIDRYGIDLSSNKGIELAIQMGILKQEDENVSFAFEEYRDYYFSKAFNKSVPFNN